MIPICTMLSYVMVACRYAVTTYFRKLKGILACKDSSFLMVHPSTLIERVSHVINNSFVCFSMKRNNVTVSSLSNPKALHFQFRILMISQMYHVKNNYILKFLKNDP